MKLFQHRIVCVAFLSGSVALAVGGEYYKQFSAVRGTNTSKNIRVGAPGLVDTNNTTLKVTNFVESVKQFQAQGQFAGIGPGMTMEEVVAVLGKPYIFWSWCYGGPRLCYKDASVIFDPTMNKVMKIRLETFYLGNDTPDAKLSVSDCIRIFGEPTSRTDRDLIYDRQSERLRLGMITDQLFYVQLERLGFGKQ